MSDWRDHFEGIQTPPLRSDHGYRPPLQDGIDHIALLDVEAGGTGNTGSGGGGGGSSVDHPFKVTDQGGGEVQVAFGTVKSIPASGYNTNIAVSDGDVIYLDCTLDGSGLITAVDIGSGASLPADTSTHAYVMIATIGVTAGEVDFIGQSITHSLWHQQCGEDVNNFWGV